LTSAYGDLVVQRTSTVGTGTATLTTALAPYMTAAQAFFRDGDTVDYSIVDPVNGASESGTGVLGSSQTTLTRNVLQSTNSNALLSLSGSAFVRVTPMRRSFEILNRVIQANYGII
jgi:hypothetical protein